MNAPLLSTLLLSLALLILWVFLFILFQLLGLPRLANLNFFQVVDSIFERLLKINLEHIDNIHSRIHLVRHILRSRRNFVSIFLQVLNALVVQICVFRKLTKINSMLINLFIDIFQLLVDVVGSNQLFFKNVKIVSKSFYLLAYQV